MLAEFEARVTGVGYGFVYVMSYPGSGKVKIGHSVDPIERAAQIGGTLAPETPVVEVYFWCSERREEVERKTHAMEAGNRRNGEWFELSLEQAVSTIREAADLVNVEVKLVYDRQDVERELLRRADIARRQEEELGRQAEERLRQAQKVRLRQAQEKAEAKKAEEAALRLRLEQERDQKKLGDAKARVLGGSLGRALARLRTRGGA